MWTPSYYHGHGTEVLKNHRLLTRKGTAIPVDELVSFVIVDELINPVYYCLVLGCCSNYKADDKAKKRLEKATRTRAKDFGDRLITVSAAQATVHMHLSPFSRRVWIERFAAFL